ncbi:MAG: SDR family oxidoreductase, partial [Pseudomonadota bacterium]
LVAQLPPGSAGNVVNLLDQKVGFPLPDYLSYSLTKFGLANATAMLARELAPQVRVNAIAPGLTLPSGTQTEAEFRDAHARTPLARGNQLEDLVAALRYLLDAPAVSGQTLFVDGGQHLRPAADPTLEG